MITEGAVAGLERCRLFLADKNLQAVLKAAQTIEQKLAILETDPRISRPLDDFPELRGGGWLFLLGIQFMCLLSGTRKKQGINKTVYIVVGFFNQSAWSVQAPYRLD